MRKRTKSGQENYDDFQLMILKGWYDMNYWSRIESIAKKNENRIALSYDDRQVTYKELYSKANNYANELVKRKIEKGENVCIVGSRSIELFSCILGVMKVNGAFVIVDAGDDLNKIEYRIRNSKSRYVFLDENSVEIDSDAEYIGLREIYQKDNVEVPAVERCPEDVMYLAYTSGTVAEEKAVMVSYDNLESYINDFISVFDICEEDINVQQTPLGYDGLCEEFFSTITSGGKMILLDKMVLQSPRLLYKALVKNGVTLFASTPLMLNELNKLPPVETVKRYISCADVLKKYNYSNLIKNAKIYNTYGLTETTVCSTYYLCKEDDDLITPIGNAFPSSKIEIVNEDMNPVEVNQIGEILIGGKGTAIGYYNNPALTKEKYIEFNEERFFRTGDYGYYDNEHVLRYEGRRDSVEKLKGIKVNCLKIEETLLNSQKVSACLAHVCQYNGNSVLCMFYVTEIENIEEDFIKKYLEDNLSGLYLPKAYIRVDHIPQRSIGKIDYAALEGLYYKSRVDKKVTSDKNEIGFLTAFQNVIGQDRISMTDKLTEIGIDSIFFIQIVLELESLFDIEFDDNRLTYGEYDTVGKVYEYVVEKTKLN